MPGSGSGTYFFSRPAVTKGTVSGGRVTLNVHRKDIHCKLASVHNVETRGVMRSETDEAEKDRLRAVSEEKLPEDRGGGEGENIVGQREGGKPRVTLEY